jgi:hypothetical protein
MVKLPDPGALGQSPNLRGARGAQVDPRLLRGGVGDVLEGAMDSAKAYQQGGQAIARSMGTAGEALGRAAGGDVALGRTIQDVGGEAGRATARAGAAVSNAMEKSGDYWAKAVREAGEDDKRAFNELGAAFQKTAGDIVEFQLAQDKQDFARARTAEAIARDNLDQEFQRDKDYSTMPDRYAARLREINETSRGLIKNPAFQSQYDSYSGLVQARSLNNIKDRAFGVERDINNASRQEGLQGLEDAAMRTKDDVVRTENLRTGQGRIDSDVEKGYITAEQGQQEKRLWSQRYAKADIRSRPPEEQLEILGRVPVTREDNLNRIIGVEGTGKNPRSSAVGVGQFTDETWLATVQAKRPDLMEGRSRDAVLALKHNPTLAKEMTGHLYDNNEKVLRGAGIIPSSGDMYLAHFLGAGTAAKAVKADPNTPISAIVSREAIEANPTILSGKTVGQVVAWADGKMGGSKRGTGTTADFISPEDRQVMQQQAVVQLNAQRTQESHNIRTQIELQLEEVKVGNAVLPPRDEILKRPGLSDGDRLAAIKVYDTVAKERGNYADVLRLYTTPGATANPFDKDHRKGVDKLYDALKGHMGAGPAAEAISRKLKIVPEEVVTDMRGALVSNDPKKVEAALQAATNLMRNNEHAFAGHQSTKGITDSADTFSYYVERLRFTPAEAAERIIREGIDKDDRKANFKKRLKDEKIDDIIVKNTDESELRQQFNEGWFFSKPGQIEYTPKQRDEFIQSYRELVQSNYMEDADGDVEKAKSKAITQLKRGGGWGVTSVTGRTVVTNFPPEKAPVYSGIKDLSDRIAKQAVDDVKTSTGEAVDRSRIRLVPLPKGGTSIEFDAGRPPPYMLMYQDRNGTWQVHPQNFVADPRVMRGEIISENVKASEAYRQRLENLKRQGIPQMYGEPVP